MHQCSPANLSALMKITACFLVSWFANTVLRFLDEISALRRPEISFLFLAFEVLAPGLLDGLDLRHLSDRDVPPGFVAGNAVVVVGFHHHHRCLRLLL